MTQPGGQDRPDDAEKQTPLDGAAHDSTDQNRTEETAAQSPDDADSRTEPPEETESLGEGSDSRPEDPDAPASEEEPDAEKAAPNGPGAETSDTAASDAETGTSTSSSRRSRREAAGDVPAERLSAVPFILAAVLVIVLTGGALWWFLGREDEEESVEHTRAEEPTNGIILADAPPEEWVAGDCLRDFDPEDDLSPATIISCDWDYDAQLIHWEDLDGGEYPGVQAVEEQALEVCDTAQQEVLDQEAVADYHPLEGVVVHPDETTWEDDPRVNCLLQRADGEQMNGNFVQDPEEDSSAETDDEDGGSDAGAENGGDETDDEDGGGEADVEEAEETE